MNQKPTYIDLFAGCGGLSLGLCQAGWQGLFAIEKNKDAFSTLRHNLVDKKRHFDWVEWLPQTNLDINEVLASYRKKIKDLRGKVDLIAGGPPCQGFSTAGKRQEDDFRNGLIRAYLKFVSLIKPKIIFFENVKGFTLKFEKNKTRGIAYSQFVLAELDKLGYKAEGEMVNFSRFGVPQKRTRFILVGIRKDVAKKTGASAKDFFSLLEKNRMFFLAQKGLASPGVTLEQAISDLLFQNGTAGTPDRARFQSGKYAPPQSPYQILMRSGYEPEVADSHSFANHRLYIRERFAEILEASERNKNLNTHLREKYKISKHTIVPLSGSDQSPTLTTLPDDFIHYAEPRILTVREYARVQGFPDWYEFKGKYTTGSIDRKKDVPRYTQVGNAIPPLFSEQGGIALIQLLHHA
ncbi:MAG: DNA cytosine methyltransferase [Bacteroidetes bacterium]|nr:DNA cytosine methyltransferase [Bacteroidota bacterium]